MSKYFLLILCATTLVLLVLLDAKSQKRGPASPKLQLIETGQFHGDEVKAKTGERWLGLFQSEQGFALKETPIVVKTVRDEMVDADEDPPSGKEVSVRVGDPLFLVRGIAELRERKVVTVFQYELKSDDDVLRARTLRNAEVLKFQLGNKQYRLQIVSKSAESVDYLLPDSKLILTSGDTTQTLETIKDPTDASWSLIWAGDLDADGELDLYLDLPNHYNVSARTLFLSSKAGKRKLVREMAIFTTVGC
jgi:hypothetical protein